jgi:GTP-binding protein EngB required for normal cell division
MKSIIIIIVIGASILYFLRHNANAKNKIDKVEKAEHKAKAVSVNESLNIENLKEEIIFRYLTW